MWTNRVIVALLNIESQVTFWPDAEEREEISHAFEADFDVIGGCVGIIDGFHVVLNQRPGRHDGADFFNRKGSYSFNILGICDHQRRLRHLSVGNVGRAGDNKMWANTRHSSQPEQSFTGNQYVLADSAFSPSDHCVPMFPRLKGDTELLANEKTFNRRMAPGRAEVEHSFGMLKCRFSCLRGLRVSIRNPDDEHKVGAWIRSCVVLHNLLLDDPEPFTDYEPEPTFQPEEPPGPAPRGKELSPRHHPLRMSLMQMMGLGAPGGPVWVTRR